MGVSSCLQSWDRFADGVSDDTTRSSFGGLVTMLVLPLLLGAYTAVWIVDQTKPENSKVVTTTVQ